MNEKPGPRNGRLLAMALGLWLPLAAVAGRAAHSDLASLSARDLPAAGLFYFAGCVSAAAFVSSLQRHPGRAVLICLVYLPFLPAGAVLALAGGIFGPAGIIVGATAAFIIPWGICRALPRKRTESARPETTANFPAEKKEAERWK